MKKIVCILFCGVFLSVATAQVEPLYFLRGNNSALLYNPGTPAFRKVYVGIGISQFQLNVGSDFLTYNNLIVKGDDGYKYLNTETLLSIFKDEDRNFMALELHEELLGVGVSVRKMYVAASMNLRSETSLRLPGEALAYLLQGNGGFVGTPVRSEIMANSSSWMEIGLTVQRTFKDKYTVGLRPKYLVGLLNAKTENASLELYTDNDWNLHLKAQADAFLNMPDPDWISDQFAGGASFAKVMDFTRQCMKGNSGFGMDLGANAEFNKHIGAAVSLTDLGRIRWKNEAPYTMRHYTAGVNENSSYYKDGYLTFEGVDFDCLRSVLNGESPWESLGDTLKSLFSYDEEKLSHTSSYTTGLNPKLMLEAHYSFTKNHRLYLLNRTDFFPEKVKTSFSLAYSGHFASFFDLALSYSFRNQFAMRHALGIGANFHCSLLNFYFSLYNINLDFENGYYQWKNLNSIALQAGVYFSLGQRDVAKNKKKKTKEKES